ncbi:MAG: SUMF1/EgtB/PvdO family nonheme iron enzyme [Candidatus Phaeomarinobacter sp.]
MRTGVAALCLLAAAACDSAADRAQQSDLPDAAVCGLDRTLAGSFAPVPSGSFVMGHNGRYPEEKLGLRLHVESFDIQVHEVTNAQFAAFVAATGYQTSAEKDLAEGRADAGSAVFSQVLDGSMAQNPWRLVPGATWKTPGGPDTTIDGRENHPVVHVSLNDARAYAAWAGVRLPTEVEWEYAASIGLPDSEVTTSGAYAEDGSPRANTWQGVFPFFDQGEDGFLGSAPVGCFAADRNGLYDMIGNVWELTDTPYSNGAQTIKGGSYLCADNFCLRYRPEARQPLEMDFSTNHIGFRVVRDDAS